MRIRNHAAGLAALAVLAGASVAATGTDPAVATDGRDDVVVIAVVDNAFTPYHLDFRADRMPQHLDADPSNDLPLDTPPHEWIPDFPDPSTFNDYRALNLTLPESGPIRAPFMKDAGEWSKVRPSSAAGVNFYWAPGTKAVGMVDFGGGGFNLPAGSAHGVGTSSVSAGAIHGTCPECVVVFIPYGGSDIEAASNWAMQQDWIDVVTNSWGLSLISRDRLYSGSNTDLQRTASERGQTIFFSAGNGQGNTFTAPNTTLFSSQEGPDWNITVGAISPDEGGSYTGHGKPADIAALGSGYPSAPSSGNSSVDSEGTFGGTSNATPVVAGMYARALWWARTHLDGPSKTQADGVVASGAPRACGEERPDCELGDGVLTAAELRSRLFAGAVHTAAGYDPLGPVGGNPSTPRINWEQEFLNEGHGSYFARADHDDAVWLEEFGRIVGPMDGTAAALERPAGEAEWFVVDSYCRQSIWGEWADGDYLEGETDLPGPDPLFPTRSTLEATCGEMFPPVG